MKLVCVFNGGLFSLVFTSDINVNNITKNNFSSEVYVKIDGNKIPFKFAVALHSLCSFVTLYVSIFMSYVPVDVFVVKSFGCCCGC